MLENIHFYYTNDLHSQFDHWSRVATFIKMKRLESKEKEESSWVVDIGDHLDRVHPITEATMGKANVELMNELSYDFVTIGNNEGIALAHNDLYHLYDDASFEVICSNLHCTKSENPLWLRSSTIVKSNKGVTVGVIGLTATFNAYYNLLGWQVEPIFETIEKELKLLTKQTDVIVLLSHLGIRADESIAEHFPQIDVIIGGHTHHLLRTGEIVNNTIITAAGKHCTHVGEVTITWDHEQNKIINKKAITTEVADLHRDLRTEQRLNELSDAANFILSKRIITSNAAIKVNWFKETLLMKVFTEELRRWTNANCAMLNAGILLDEFPSGEITYRDVHRICPHPINPCVVLLTGNDLKEVIKESFSKQFMELKLKGFGFRGEILGRMIFSGMDVKTEISEAGEEYVTEISIEGKPLHPDVEYRVVTADTFTFGQLLPLVAKSKVKELFLPEFLREILVRALLRYGQYETR